MRTGDDSQKNKGVVTIGPDYCQVEVPGTNGQVVIRSMVREGDYAPVDYWWFVAALSGVTITIRAREHDDASSWSREYECHPSSLWVAIELAQDLYAAMVKSEIPLYSASEDIVRAAIANTTFFDNGSEVVATKTRRPPKKPRLRTQKILDGGEDMTV